MKKVIDGMSFNTETATPVARKAQRHLVPAMEEVQTIYQTRGGALFEHHVIRPDGSGETEALKPCSEAALKRCIAAGWEVLNTYWKKGDAPTTLYLRIPASLKRRLKARADAAGQSENTWAMRCIERCLEEDC